MPDDHIDDENRKSLVIFGRDVGQIPCFRSSFLYGVGSGCVAGLAYFMVSSRVRASCHVAYGTFFSVTVSYWLYCRYRWAQMKFHHGQLQGLMKKPMQTITLDQPPDEA